MLAVYDCVLTLDTEFPVYWSHKPKLSSVIYFVNRYVEMASFIAAAVLVFPVGDQVSICLRGHRRYSDCKAACRCTSSNIGIIEYLPIATQLFKAVELC